MHRRPSLNEITIKRDIEPLIQLVGVNGDSRFIQSYRGIYQIVRPTARKP